MTPELQAQIEAAKKRLRDWIARSAGQHKRAVRKEYERAQMRLLARWNRVDAERESSDSLGSPRRLNPAFGCWLQNLPYWWTNPGVTNSAQLEMESFRRRQQSHLSNLLDGLD